MREKVLLFITALFMLLGLFCTFAEASDQSTIAVIDLEVPHYLTQHQVSLSNRFRSELVNTGKFTVVERNKMNQILEEQKLSLTGLIDSNFAVKIGKMLGVRQIITGSLAKVGNIFTVSVRVIDVETGKITNTADIDCECSIEDVLVITLKAVSKKLSGMPADVDGFSKSKKRLPPKFTFEELARYSLPFKADRYADMTWGDDRLYIGTNEGNIYRINTELGLKVEEVYPVKKSHISGLAWDGTNLWSAQMNNGYIIKFNKTDRVQAIDFVFRIPGGDTYPYAMAIDGNELYTVGYSKRLKRYKIIGPTDLTLIAETEIGIYDALAIVDGRIFVARGTVLEEVLGGNIRPLSVKMPEESCTGMTYDGRYFWVLTGSYLYKYKVNRQETEAPTVSTSAIIIRGEYPYAPQRPISVAWDGSALWSVSAHGETAGIHKHDSRRNMGVAQDFYRPQIRASILYAYGSFTWDGKFFITTTSTFDGREQTIFLVRLTHDYLKNDQPEIRAIETKRVPLEDITALTWADGYLFAATGQKTQTSGEGAFVHKLHQEENGEWVIVKTFKYIGLRCQGLAWDGLNLWSYDVFKKRFYKHNPETLEVLSEIGGTGNADLEYFSGLAWDGKSFWTGNYKTNEIYKIEFITSNE